MRHAGPLLWCIAACRNPTPPDPGGPVIDLHTHCMAEACDPGPVEEALDGRLTAAALSLEHYRISERLGDPIPDAFAFVRDANEIHAAAAERSDHVVLFASLDCLNEVPASDPGWVQRCLDDADRWLDAGAVGFKDHAGKSWDGGGEDLAMWVGAWNRLAGWCQPDPDDPTPNTTCLAAPDARMPLDDPGWRAVVRGIVEDRGVPLISHATPWREADTWCTRHGETMPCFEAAADALADFAAWARAELSPEARRRFVVAHAGFFAEEDPRLAQILDAGLSMDLAQTAFTDDGCRLRRLVAGHTEQFVFGTDGSIGDACMPRHYEAWMWALLGASGRRARYTGTCRGKLRVVGAALDDPQACGVTLPADAHRRILHDNAAALLGRP